MARLASYSNDHAPSLRNLKLLVVLLAVSNILVGAFSVYLLRDVDQRYSELIGRSVPALNDLRELMTDTVLTMRSTNPALLNGPESARPAAIAAMRTALATEQKFRTEFLAGGGLDNAAGHRTRLRRIGADFDQQVAGVIELYAAGNLAEAARAREQSLRPAFEQLFAGAGKAADAVESVGLTANKDFTSKTNTLAAIVLSVASWPVLVLVGLLLVTAVFVIVMMVAFRGKDLVDAP